MNTTSWPAKIINSIFLKLICVLILAGILINIVVHCAFQIGFAPPPREFFDKSMKQFATYLASDVASGQEFDRAETLSKDLGLGVRIEGEGWKWSSDSRFTSDKFHFR